MKKKFVIFICIVLFITLSIPSFADCYYMTGSHGLTFIGEFTPRLKSSPDNINYFRSTNVNFNSFSANAAAAANIWNYTVGTDSIYLGETTSYWTSNIDLAAYDGNSSAYSNHSNSLGFTRLWYGDGAGATNNRFYESVIYLPSLEDYWGAECFINYTHQGIDPTNSTKVKAILSHEIGHALGLFHPDSIADSIMRSTYSDQNPSVPTSDDYGNVFAFYYDRIWD